jgi:hypothetical protein
MLALSTSWKSSQIREAQKLLQILERLPISGIELEYRISEATYRQMESLLPPFYLTVQMHFPIVFSLETCIMSTIPKGSRYEHHR